MLQTMKLVTERAVKYSKDGQIQQGGIL
jgi:hypothetical protein